MMKPIERSLYLAGPFFNPEQLAEIQMVEGLCEKLKVTCISPRKFLVLPPKASWQDRQLVFQKNCSSIMSSELVLACIDGQGSLDPGTVWEMGYAFAMAHPVVCFTLNGKKMNVMLAQGCHGFLENEEQLMKFITGKAGDYSIMKEKDKWWDWDWQEAQKWRKDIY